ncbi:MAG: division/cell wall cluster transcriptional repressor MraZ [Syntrophomonadaceae bacterium]|nr:division/cell wall cluster transcriptional repressor MraZ [Syntrophomonadaceae bacterium]
MFLGEYQHSLDPKGRITIPSKFREQLGDKFVITKGLDNCLFLYSIEEWHLLEIKLKSLPFTRADARSFMRFFFAGASEVETDKQGRIVLPSNLREYAKIERDVTVIGVGTRVEIWSNAVWDVYTKNAELSYEQIAENLVELGL